MGVGRLEYNSIQFDFLRAWNRYQLTKRQNQSVTRSLSGIRETLEFFNQDFIEVIRNFLKPQEVHQLQRWYEYVRDGSSFKLWRDVDIALYLSFEGKSLLTANGVDATFTRTNPANYINPDNGYLVAVTTDNTARFPEGQFGRGFLIEESFAQCLTNTDDFSNAAWVKSDLTVTANQAVGIDGSTLCDKLAATNDQGSVSQISATAIGTDDGCFSVYLRTHTGSSVSCRLALMNDPAGSYLSTQDITVTDEWVRYYVIWVNTGDPGGDWKVNLRINTNGDIIYASCAQLEEKLFPTTYEDSARNAEAVYWAIDADEFTSFRQYSVSFWYYAPWLYSISTNRYFIVLYDTNTSCKTFECKINSSNNYEANCYPYANDGSAIASNSYTAAGTAVATWYNIVITVDTTIANGMKMYKNGTLVNTSTNSEGRPGQPTRLYLGRNSSTDGWSNCVFDDVALFNKVLTADEVSSIYNSTKALNYIKNYYSAVKLVNPEFNPVQRTGSTRWDFEAQFEEVLT